MNNNILIAMIGMLAILIIVALILGIINTSKINSLLDYSEDGNLVDNLEKYYNNVRDLQKKLRGSQEGTMNDRILSCESKANMSLSKIGIVNFNAFDDVHGNQSFAVAVLNQYNDGFVITSLYGNSSSNSYIRSIKSGRSATKLIDEEKEAINKAMTGDIEITE